MVFKILFVILFVTICSGALPVHPQTKPNQAVYSQSFVREDVPVSYQYSAVHYYTPKKHEASNEVNPVTNFNNPAQKPVRDKTIQFAPIAPNPREYSYPTAPVLYTSIITDPVSQYGKYELTENSPESVLNKYNLEPKVPFDAKNVNPSTYKPHMNHNIKIFHSSRLRPDNYRNLNTPTVMTIETAPAVEMSGKLNNAELFQLLEQQLIHQAKYIATSTTETPTPIFSHIRNLGVSSFLPKHGTPLTIPHEFYGHTPFQPIPRVAYNKVNVVPEKQARAETSSSHRVHLNKPKIHTHLQS